MGNALFRISQATVCAVLFVLATGEPALSGDSAEPRVPPAARMDAMRLAGAQREPDQWFTSGRDAGGTYYSPLDSINDRNAERLGFAWDYKLGTERGLEATPVVVDGIMYTTGNWGRVYALDAATGKLLWDYDPEVTGQWGRYACCDVVNRGLAVWKGRVYVASIDGYLHALDARTGRRVWRVDTLSERNSKGIHYFVTGAPIIAGNVVAIGNGGSDFKGARGSISAYDLETGAFKWRFFTVPRNPRLGAQDQPDLDAAVKTWPAAYDWSMGGGGSPWDGLAYDAELGLLYFGTGNASPYHGPTDPATRGDLLYVASIVAVHAATGQMAWYYQEIPGEGSDYDTTNKLVLTDLRIAGKARKVIMQASKNGFLYVLDRTNGEFLSGTPFTYVNWTKGLDPTTHRPVMNPASDWTRAPALLFPAATGAHSWQPMSFSATTGLVYVPVIDAAMVYVDTSKRRAGLIEGNFELAFFFPEDYDPTELAGLFGKLPSLESLSAGRAPPKSRGVLRAIQPSSGKIVWEHQTASLWDGGVMSTGGNLVVQGDVEGHLNVYAADSGKLLKRIDVGTSIMAAPMSYRIGGTQYISVMAGYGGGILASPFPVNSAAYKYGNQGRIVTFRLDGGTIPQPMPVRYPADAAPPPREGSAAAIAQGEVLYDRYCSRCHVFGHGLLPDLRRMAPATHAIFYDIVLGGVYQPLGMARWDDVLSRSDAAAIHAYLVDQAWNAGQGVPLAEHASALQ